MNIQIARVSGSLWLDLTLTLKEIVRPKLGGKRTAVFVDSEGNETRMTVGDTLNLNIPLSTVSSTNADQTVQKIKDVIKELSK